MRNYSEHLSDLSLSLRNTTPSALMPDLPCDPTSLADEEVMTYLLELTEWGIYARAQAVDAIVLEKEKDRIFAHAVALAIREASGKTLAEKKFEASLHPDVTVAESQHLNAWARRTALEAAAETAERRASALSRELSRRGAKTSRASKWSP